VIVMNCCMTGTYFRTLFEPAERCIPALAAARLG
jgi:hypothetical protein